jgi:iron complex transport system permease protein
VAWAVGGTGAVVVAVVLGLVTGPASISPWGAILSVVGHIPGVHLRTGLTHQESVIIWELRLPRVVLGLFVGAMLATAGASYQGVFRNPLADPFLLGVAAGAGLGATIAIVSGLSAASAFSPVPLAAFVGALGAVLLTYSVGATGDRTRSPAALILAGVAVASLLTALQTFVQQRDTKVISQVYTWLLGRLTVTGWSQVELVLPYAVVTFAVLFAHRRLLDVLSVGDHEATTLGVPVDRTRLIVVIAASFATAAAVAVSGLIAFVGIIVPHTIRLLGGTSYRTILPLSMLFGGAFLVLADLVARQAMAPAELPIGVVTAFFGAPFFVMLLRSSRGVPTT